MPSIKQSYTTGSQVAEQRLLGKCLTTLPRIGGVINIYSQKISARFSSESAAPTVGNRIHSRVLTKEIAELLQCEVNDLCKEDLVLVLEQVPTSSNRK